MRWVILGIIISLGVAFIWPIVRKSGEVTSDWTKRQQDIKDEDKKTPPKKDSSETTGDTEEGRASKRQD